MRFQLSSSTARMPTLPHPVTHPLSSSHHGGGGGGGGTSSTHSSNTFGNLLKAKLRGLPRRNVLQRFLLSVFSVLCVLFFVAYVRSERTDVDRASRLLKEQEDHAWLAEDGDDSPFQTAEARVQHWGVSRPGGPHSGVTPKELLQGLVVIPDNDPSARPLTDLGTQADATFRLGPRTLKSYVKSLKAFVTTSMPTSRRDELLQSIDRYTSQEKGWLWRTEKFGGGSNGEDTIWMTDRDGDKSKDDEMVRSWKDNGEGWKWELLDDDAANAFVMDILDDSKFGKVWRVLPTGILHADTLRYLLLAISGGIYSDTDTRRLKPISEWGQDATLWRDGKGWLTPDDRKRLDEQGHLPPPSVVVGIEADAGDRPDWHDWWPRPLQIVQWTLASAPRHPIFIDALHMIQRQTAVALEWLAERPLEIARLHAEGDDDAVRKLSEANMASEPKDGGPLGVMEWTGPGLWTDCVLRYLRIKYGVQWPDLRGLDSPTRIGDVLVLPVTGFSPGVGLFNAKSVWDPQAMVEHRFAGSWKDT